MRSPFARSHALIAALAGLLGAAPSAAQSPAPARLGGQRFQPGVRTMKRRRGTAAQFRRQRSMLPTVMGQGSQAVHRARRLAEAEAVLARAVARTAAA